MAQFGIHGDPKISAEWKDKKIKDDPVVESNKRGYVSFATSGDNTRTTQIFINFGDNTNLDSMKFAPFAKIISGMDIVDKIFPVGEGGQGDGKDKKGPAQSRITDEGNKYLKKVFPKLSYIISTSIVEYVGSTDEL
jgi:peptidyl-prolyl cis-trans isomerase A (cyclophilin A)